MNELITDTPLEFSIYSEDVSAQTRRIVGQISCHKLILSLDGIIENSQFHDFEDVLNHVQKVFANIQVLLDFNFVEKKETCSQYMIYFQQKPIANCDLTRKDLLLIASQLHDIAKGQKRDQNDSVAPGKRVVYLGEGGKTNSENHPQLGEKFARQVLLDINVSSEIQDWLINIVKNHDQFGINGTCKLTNMIRTNQYNEAINRIWKLGGEVAFELLLHIHADEYGSQITKQQRADQLEFIAQHNILKTLAN